MKFYFQQLQFGKYV